MDEYRHVLSLAHANALAYELLSLPELQRRHPFVEVHDLRGALWDPYDGDIDPAQLTQALASGARARGARIHRFTKVTALEQRSSGEWLVGTNKGEFLADVLVNAAGYRAGEIMGLLGRTLPTVTMSHQYLVTEEIPALLGLSSRIPLLRDPDVSYYLRQEKTGLILGPYEHRATPAWLDGIPEDFSYQLWDDDLDRLEHYLSAACERVPVLATAGIKRVVNGPIPYSPDGLPYLGPAHGLRAFFHCKTFSFGIAQAGGAGRALAEWVVHGGTEWDLWSIDPRRFTGYATRTYTLAKAIETYQLEYAPAFPFEERPAGRPLRTSPLHATLATLGAHYGVRGGWERALWFDSAAQSREVLAFRRQQGWMHAVAQEVRAVRNAVGLMDLPGFSKFLISGPGAEAYLDALLCTRLPSLHRIALAYALDRRGRILSEFTVTRLAPSRFYLVSAALAEHHDDDLLRSALPGDGGVQIESFSERLGTLVLAGPFAREVLSGVTRADLSNAAFPWLSAARIEVGPADVWALRVTYVGELGWELHAPVEYLAGLHRSLMQAGEAHGLRHFGLYAMDSLRIDKCYRGWKSDLDGGCSPLEASLERFVDFSKPAFVGREALLAERKNGPARRLVPLVLDQPGDADAPYGSSVYAGEDLAGMTTSGVWSHSLQKSVALAYVRRDLAVPGTALQIEILGLRRAATVHREPLLDPEHRHCRS
jgi:dimethylglycine dehydrogenase